jgi:hypothetical protein
MNKELPTINHRLFMDDLGGIAKVLKHNQSDVVQALVFNYNSISSARIVLLTNDNDVLSGFVAYSDKFQKDTAYNHLSSEQVRFTAMLSLNPDLKKFCFGGAEIPQVDILVFPLDWKARIEALNKLYYSSTPNFVERIARVIPNLTL